ncbi:MAG: Gfo/Idh/MocA family oxidoreductase [Verrucomicrobia bacterium]|nr:Gfo/Idh/MocA family oxidoreductase [Verrucomicrobiota bacterium]
MLPLNRRQFLGAVTAGAAALSQLRAQVTPAPSTARKVKLGLIGCGWYGMVDVNAAFKAGGVEIVALCDVDSDHLEKSAAEVEKTQGSRPKTFKLYEEMLATPGLEAVIIGTQPHWHALQLIAAVKRGLDVYCEKPLFYDVREGRAMVDAVAKSGRIVQIGFQRRQSPAYQAVRQFIADGHLGRIVQAEAQIHTNNGTLSTAPQPPPATLDWDLWCGPGPLIPYSPQVGHKNWRQEKTSGQGHLYDWGIHLLDATRMILGETAPRTVSAAGGLYQLKGKITTPDTLAVQWEFDRCPVTWRHRMWGAEEYAPETNNGIFFYGEKGTVFVSDNQWTFTPRGKKAERKVTEAKADMGLLHMADFLEAVRTRRPASCSIEEAHLSTTVVKLAMISYEVGAKLTWDARTEQIVGHPEAAKLLRRDYRAPWKHPSPA